MKNIIIGFVLVGSAWGGWPFKKNSGNDTVTEAPDGGYPHQVSLRTNYNKHTCGGSVLNEDWILTSAQCVSNKKPQDLTVVAGSNQLFSGGTRRRVSSIHSHENFNPHDLTNDVAVLKVDQPLPIGDKIQPVVLGSASVPAGSKCSLSGWGLKKNGFKETPNELQQTVLSTISNSECQDKLPEVVLTNAQICTLSSEGPATCGADSGNALIYQGQQVGIVSSGVPCGKGRPDLFTNVVFQNDWITERTKQQG